MERPRYDVSWNFLITYVFKENGAFEYDWFVGWGGGASSDKGETASGTLRLNAGKGEYTSEKGVLRTLTLQVDKKQRRRIQIKGDDGLSVNLKPKK